MLDLGLPDGDGDKLDDPGAWAIAYCKSADDRRYLDHKLSQNAGSV